MENQTAAFSSISPCLASKVHWGVIVMAITVVFAVLYVILAAFFVGPIAILLVMIELMFAPFVLLAAFINGAMLAGIYNVAFCDDADTMDKVAAGAGILSWVVFPVLHMAFPPK